MTAITREHDRPHICHRLHVHIIVDIFTTNQRLLLSCTLNSPVLRLYICTSLTDPILWNILFKIFSILPPTPFFHFCTSAFRMSIFSPSFCSWLVASISVDVCLNSSIHLFQLIIELVFTLPHHSLANLAATQCYGSFPCTHVTSGAFYCLNSSKATSSSNGINAYLTLLNIYFTSSLDAPFLTPCFLVTFTKFSWRYLN